MRAEPLRGVLLQQLSHENSGVPRNSLGENQRVVQHTVHHFILVVLVEGRNANEQLIDEKTQPVEVHGLSVSLLKDHLGCQIRVRAAEACSPFLHLIYVLFREPEVNESGMACAVQKNVLRLQVPVYDVVLVQGLQGEDHFADQVAHVVF